MTYLLDVNALLAFHFAKHVHYERVRRWIEARSHATTDGHRLQFASAYGSALATLDRGIPGALLIPEVPSDVNRVSEPRLSYGAAA